MENWYKSESYKYFLYDPTVLFAMTSSQLEIQRGFSPLTYSPQFYMSENWSFPDLNFNTSYQLVDYDSFQN